jgi:hypothetical protein
MSKRERELFEKYTRYKDDMMRSRDETRGLERKYFHGAVHVCDMILADLQGITEDE